MRFLYILLLLLFVSCSGTIENESIIVGRNLNLFNNKKIYFLKENSDDLRLIKLDSFVISNGSFTFKEKFIEPEFRFLMIDGLSEKLTVLIEPGEVEIFFKDSILSHSKVIRGIENSYLFDYNFKAQSITNEVNNFKRKVSKDLQVAIENNDLRKADSIKKIHYLLNYKHIQNMNEHLKFKPNNYVSLKLIEGLFKFPNYPVDSINYHFNKLEKKYQDYTTGILVKQKIDSLMKLKKSNN